MGVFTIPRRWVTLRDTLVLVTLLVALVGLHGCSVSNYFYVEMMSCGWVPDDFANLWILLMYFICFNSMVVPSKAVNRVV